MRTRFLLLGLLLMVSSCAGEVTPSTAAVTTETTATPVVTMTTVPATSTTTQATSCSASGLPFDPQVQAELPAEVAAMREEIVAAAVACDFDELERLALSGDEPFHYSWDPVDSPGPTWQEEEHNGSEPLRYLAQVMDLSPEEVRWEGSTVFVWPAAAAFDTWSEVPPGAREELRIVYDDYDFDVFATAGAYIGHRVWIGEDGDWMLYIAGD